MGGIGMGIIDKVFGFAPTISALGRAVKDTSEVFQVNATEAEAAAHNRFAEVVAAFAAESARAPIGRFGRFVDGLNRLPRPMMALGTIGLFVYAMVDPAGFGARMQGLAFIPEPLWWLLGSIVGFYFGARELYHHRNRMDLTAQIRAQGAQAMARAAAQPVAPANAAGHRGEAPQAEAPAVDNPAGKPSPQPANTPTENRPMQRYNGDNAAIKEWQELSQKAR